MLKSGNMKTLTNADPPTSPSGYHRDLQLLKEDLFRHSKHCVIVSMAPLMLSNIEVNEQIHRSGCI